MFAWWESLDMILKVLYCMTVPATIILIIQTIMMLTGFGDSDIGNDFSDVSGLDLPDDISADIPDDMPMTDGGNPLDFSSMRLLTLQTVIAFLTVFGWSSIVSLHSGGKAWLSLLIGFTLGILAMFLVAKLVQISSKLAENGTQNIRNALGKSAVVYLPIPPSCEGHGKVTLTLQGTFSEYDALTTGDIALPVGTEVRVIDIRGDMLVVEKE